MALRSTPRPVSVQRPGWRPWLPCAYRHSPITFPRNPLLPPSAAPHVVSPVNSAPWSCATPGPSWASTPGWGPDSFQGQAVTQAFCAAVASGHSTQCHSCMAPGLVLPCPCFLATGPPLEDPPLAPPPPGLGVGGALALVSSPSPRPASLCLCLFLQLRPCLPATREMRGAGGGGVSCSAKPELQAPSPPMHLEEGPERLEGQSQGDLRGQACRPHVAATF